jgi:outer membrane protein TolC
VARLVAGGKFTLMTRARCRLPGAVVVALVIGPAIAGAQRDTLTLAAARSRALATHPAIAAALAAAAAAIPRGRQGLLLEVPELDVEVGGEGPFTRLAGRATYVVPLRSSRKTGALRDLLEADARRVAQAVDLARTAVELDVTRAFYRAALLAERVRIGEDDSAALAALVENAHRRYTAGTATDIDVLRLESEASAARRRLIGDRGRHRAALGALAALLGTPTDSLPALGIDRDAVAGDSTALALVRRLAALEVAAAALDTVRARAALDLERRSRWTDPRVGGSYGVEQGEPVLSAVVRLPLPARHGNAYAIRAAELDARAAEARLAAALRRADVAVRGAAAARDAAAAQLTLVSQDLVRLRTAEALARRRLEEGGPYLQIWLDIRRDRIALEREALDLLAAAATASLGAPDEGGIDLGAANSADREVPR